MNGFLLIDKKEGMTSHDVVARVRRITGIRKVGHTGTLDPMATGVLPIAVGQATRMSEYMLACDKVYTGTFLAGTQTDTYDRMGTVTANATPDFTQTELLDVFSSFVGCQKQLPPMYSAKKIGGKKLYELARKGETVERAPADIEIFRLIRLPADHPDLPEVTDSAWRHPAQIGFLAHVSKGTYIRSLVHDIGQKLGCGAVLTSLRRTQTGSFHLKDCRPLAAFETMDRQAIEKALTPPDRAIYSYDALEVSPKDGIRLSQGQRLVTQHSDQPLLRVYAEGRFLGPGYIEEGILKLRKVLEI